MSTTDMQKLLDEHTDIALPQVGDVVEGVVISAANNEVHIDIGGIATGLVRGPELVDESGMFTNLKPGITVHATVVEQENEMGELELSFREAGHQKAWEELDRIFREQEIVGAHILDANKGGLLVRVGNVSGFLPVSQLTVEHYPRVEGANKAKILERLKTYIGMEFQVRIIDVAEQEGKMIVSEKAAKEQEQSARLSEFKVGDTIEGVVTGVVNFGAFVEFGDNLEGLVHISELAWQRIDNPKDIIKVGDAVKAQIIAIDDGRISLSIRRLQHDPWKAVAEKYKVGDVVEGMVLKINPFGAFVELDNDIHGLAHISELSWKKITSPEEVLKIGEKSKFKIVSIEPDNHRLGLSVKQLTARPASAKKKDEKEEGSTEEKTETPVEEKVEETKAE
ncbi:MAG: S1 RNA-binding domain-containing protein [Candidatus Kerfeldbacteria bacterium]|nr:S1 RNA-binding domain-containing protein [Candidatus Kerfeldbacteria bacterium]